MKKNIPIFLLSLLLGFPATELLAQVKLTGKIVDANLNPVAGATIFPKGSTQVVQSNAQGEFQLEVPALGIALLIQSVGYETKQLAIDSNSPLQIQLTASDTKLNEVVVTALGITRQKKSLGYAVQEVKSAELSTRPTNALSAISGKVAGLQIVSSGGNMGGSTRVQLRGINSITGNNQPLYVIDGTPIDNTDMNTGATSEGSAGKDVGNLIQDINPDDIENISVLKGPSAAALYGSRAANGVILITTKRASRGEKVEIAINTGLDFENVNRLPKRQQLYGQGYATTFPKATINGTTYDVVDLASDESWGPKLDGTPVLQWYNLDPENKDYYLKTSPWVYPKNDVQYFFKTGISNTNNLSIAGNSGNTSYRFSYTNKNVSGTTPNASLGRNTLNFSGGTSLGKVKISSNLNYIKNSSLGRPWTGATNRGIMLSAFQWGGVQVDYKLLEDYQRADGTQKSWNRTSWQNTAAAEATRFIDNPYWAAYTSYLEENRDRFYGNIGLQYEANDWLTLGAKVHGDIYQYNYQDRIASYSRSQSQYQEVSNNLNEYNYEFLATAKKNFNNFSLVANIGANLRDQKRRTSDAVTQGGLIIPNYYNIKNATSVLLTNNTYHRRISSVYASASLGWNDLLFLDGTIRVDKSSTLPAKNNTYTYPSVTGSFLFSQLEGLKNVDWLSFGKVRLGWAKVGNDTDPYQLGKVYEVRQAISGNPAYNLPSILNNAELKPEMTSSFETGINLQFFNNRLGLDVTYYNNNSVNQIIAVPISSAFGYDNKYLNAGKINNRGLEIILNGTPIRTDNFSWNTTVNFSKNRNKVVKLDDQVNTLTLSSNLVNLVAREGQSYGQILGYDFVYGSNGDRVVQADGTYMRTSQLQNLGSVLPDFMLGFQNQFRYKNFNIGFLIDARVGGKFFSQTYKVGMYSGIWERTADNNIREIGVVLDGVKADVTFNADGSYVVGKETENTTNISALNWARNEYNGPTTFSVFDATFVKLREVTFGYQIPLKNKNLVKSLAVGVYGRNLWNIYSKSPLIDPEITSSGGNVQGIEGGNIPLPVSYGFNVNIKF